MNDALNTIIDKIIEDGLSEEDFQTSTSILEASLKKRGVETIGSNTAINELNNLLSSDIDRLEKARIMTALMALAAHHKFQLKLKNRQIRDFEAGNNMITFFHPVTGQEIGTYNKKTLTLIQRTRAMMLFPEPIHRTLRDNLIRDSGHNLRFTRHEKIRTRAFKRYLRMMTIGVVFKLQCEHWTVAKRRRSLNIIMAANQKGFFSEWDKADLKVGTARKYMKDFASVRHLLAADLSLTLMDKQEDPAAHEAGFFGLPFTSFLVSPERFFLAAEQYRQWALDAGFIQRKKDLWMPEGWRNLVQGAAPLEMGQFNPDYLDEIRRFDDFEKDYRAEKEWMKN